MSGKDESIFSKSALMATKPGKQIIKQGLFKSKGKGAFLDDKQISVHKDVPLYKIVGVNISGASQEIMKKLQPVIQNHSHLRHFGANALEMAMFAQGLIDIFIDLRNNVCVGLLLGL